MRIASRARAGAAWERDMDRELVAFVGAGLQIVASGMVASPPAGSLRDGFRFVEYLVAFGGPGLSRLAIGGVQSIWLDWRRSKLPRIVAVEHIRALPGLLEDHRIDRGRVLSTLAAMGDTDAGRSSAAFKLTTIIIERVTAAGAFEEADLSRQLTFFFIERLLLQVLAERGLIKELSVPITRYFAEYARDRAAAQDPDAVTSGYFGGDFLHGWQPGEGVRDSSH
jgi:hypothetical protein